MKGDWSVWKEEERKRNNNDFDIFALWFFCFAKHFPPFMISRHYKIEAKSHRQVVYLTDLHNANSTFLR